jgi:hypothetical protein
VLGLALVSGIGYMLWPKAKKPAKESAPNSAEKVLIELNSKKTDESTPPTPTPPDAPNPTVNQPPTPAPPPVPTVTPETKPPSPPQPVPVQIVELPPAELDRDLMATVFLPVKSSERFKAFQTTLITKGAGKFNVERHSKILRLIIHETSEKFARDLKQPALAEQIKTVHDKRIKTQPAETRNIRASEADIYSPNESAVWSEEKQAVINWKNAETRLAFDISSDAGRFRVKINQACPNPEGQSFRVIFGKDISNPTAPLKTAGEMAFVENDAGTFVVVKNGTYRLWIEPVAMAKSGDFMRVRGITIEKIKP